ncbi:unnamed protein product (macronuclear) [Paramecium tetraurelia]|uniref:Uncharacterized protein n=1 Tax=Paramecium tetraurelia TaxID=5888 RepID=A0DJJ8_PARTE|nr:uncharacterized protein GSPATT00017559001 [Paramecium tetraurelia]CAK83215.1 unnamed protein product [Paramecium tetraurelia]|eukprot:XP_001450612.1 hypothetical protein (macronuclear) [Paramecium tetraurelia strain d4-2]
MNLSRFYSRHNKLYPIKSKHKSLQKSTSYTPQKNRSVTYNNNEDLLKLIINNENLLGIVENIQKQRQVQRLVQETNSNSNLPTIPKVEKQNQNLYLKQDRKRRSESIPYTFQLNPKNIPYYQENRIYGKFIEPTEYKKIDYESMKTIEIALSKQFQQEFELKNQLIQIKERSLLEDLIQQQSLELQDNKNKNCHSQETLASDDQDKIFKKKAKINQIVSNTLKLRKYNQEQNNQQKLSLEFQIKDEFQKYLNGQFCNESIYNLATNQNQYIKKPKYTKIIRK